MALPSPSTRIPARYCEHLGPRSSHSALETCYSSSLTPLTVKLTKRLRLHFKLAWRLPLDGMNLIPYSLDPDVHYELLSKRGLAVAPFPTPRYSHLLDLNLDESTKWQMDSEIPEREDAVEFWMNEITMAVSNQALPFVLELQQTIFGKGTFIVKTEDRRSSLLAQPPNLMRSNADRTNKYNKHLLLSTFVITNFIDSPEDSPSFAITFFVRRNGTHAFINCCEQSLSNSNTWNGSSITFSQQDRHQKYFSKTVADVASYLHSKGYYGCVGIDVLEDKLGKQWVVDMNVRPPGSLILGLVKGFLSVDRDFDEASLLSSVKVKATKETFLGKLSEEFDEGRLIMLAWYEDLNHKVNWTSLIISGKTKEAVNNLIQRIDE
ncbi:hypothetical protein BDZ45DRAFT_602008 [Acephala macrosclerotiorum]|nr:hypothetical protein BDZ45DRAFT_602008 [Acephala macrosclerotiorum]